MSIDALAGYQAHLPSGAAWPQGTGTNARAFAAGLSKEFERIADRVEQLLLEADPRTTTELIEGWERIAGLPDPCASAAPDTIEGRRAAVVARIVGRGSTSGPGVAFLTQVLATLGYAESDIVIRRAHHQPFTCDSSCVDPLNPDDAGWLYVWEIIAEHGDLDTELQCQILNRYGFAHLSITFAFPLFSFGDGTFSRAGSGVLTDPETEERVALDPDELGTFYFGA